MNESQTRFLIQRELDGNLSQEEELRLRRVLMVNDSAVSFRANLSQIVAAVHDLELPDSVRPGDSSQLAIQIIDSLPVAKANFWDPFFDIFANRNSKRKSDPRSTRSVANGPSTRLKAVSVQPCNTSTNSGKGSGIDSSPGNQSVSTSTAQGKIDPAVLAPKKDSLKEAEKDKTPHGLPAVDQYVTGTHSAIGGLGKRLNINKNNAPIAEVGKTLADAIREKVHEHLREEAEHSEFSEHSEQYSLLDEPMDDEAEAAAYDSVSANQNLQESTIQYESANSNNQNPQTPPDLRAQLKAELKADFSAQIRHEAPPSTVAHAVLPISTNQPNILPANITTQQFAASVKLGESMVLTVGPQNATPVTEEQTVQNSNSPSPAVNGHDFSIEELSDWKSGTYPIVPPQAKPRSEQQSETGPLVPFSVNTAASITKLNLKDTAEIVKQLAADSQREKAQIPLWVTPGNFDNDQAQAKPAAWPIQAQADWTTASTAESSPKSQPNASLSSWNQIPTPELPTPDWLAPQAKENPALPADPWASRASAAPQIFQNPWAPSSVQSNNSIAASAPISSPVPTPELAGEQAQNLEEKRQSEFPEPKIVPVTRQNALPIEAIGDRINQLFSEPVVSKAPTTVEKPSIQIEQPRQNTVLENDVNQCLASLGRLADVKHSADPSGKIKELGRFLLTDDTIEKIDSVIKRGLGHSHARVVTLDAAQQMANALEPILKFQGVVGYMVCGYDGLPITSALPADVDIELLGGCSLVSYMNSHHIIKVMGHSHIRQIIMQMPAGCMLLADFGKGILVTLTNDKDTNELAKLSETIDTITGI